MNLFSGPVAFVPLLERAVDALETIASELTTARLDRRQHMTLADMDDDMAVADAVRESDDGETGEVLEKGEQPKRRFKAHALGVFTRCPECRSWRNENGTTVTWARSREGELPACPGGAA